MIRLADIFGQDDAVQLLRSAWAADRLPHGLIFIGPEGVGKATTAGALAGLFLCERPETGEACGSCESCRAVGGGVHPDYHIITKELARLHDKSGASKATQLSIHVIRQELAAVAARKTVMGRGKVFVIEQAELMTPAAQNALLKTLEEPAGRTLIILLTTSGGDLLPTVRSRCQMVRFAPLAPVVVRAKLLLRGIEPAVATEAAQLSDGSLGLALQWIEDGVLPPAKALTSAIDELLAGRSIAGLSEMLRKSAEAYAERALERDELASKDAALRGGLIMYFGIIARRLRQRLADDDLPVRAAACDAIENLELAEKYLDANVTVSLVLEQLTQGLTALGVMSPAR